MKDNQITMTPDEQLALMDFVAIHGAFGLLAQGDFANIEDTQKAIRLASNARILSTVLERSKDVVGFGEIRDHLATTSDALVTRWKMLLPKEDIELLDTQDLAFREFAKEELKSNGLDEEEAERATRKVIPFNVLNGGE